MDPMDPIRTPAGIMPSARRHFWQTGNPDLPPEATPDPGPALARCPSGMGLSLAGIRGPASRSRQAPDMGRPCGRDAAALRVKAPRLRCHN